MNRWPRLYLQTDVQKLVRKAVELTPAEKEGLMYEKNGYSKFESIFLDSGRILDDREDVGIGLKIGPELAQRVARTVPLECGGSQNYFGYSSSSALQHGF